MLSEHSLLDCIVKDLTDQFRVTGVNKLTDLLFWKDTQGRNVLTDEESYKTVVRPTEGVRYYTDIIKEELGRYQEKLNAFSVQELQRTKILRERELASYYQQAGEQIKKLAGPLELADMHRVNALWDLTQGYIAESLVTYHDNGIEDFMHLFLHGLLPVELNAIATFANEHGIVDFNTFKNVYVMNSPSSPARVVRTVEPKSQYNLFKDYPDAKTILVNFIPDYLKSDFSLKETTTKATASVIAYAISTLLNMPLSGKIQYFETLWGLKDLKGSFRDTQNSLRYKIFEIASKVQRPEYGGSAVVDNKKLDELKKALSA